MKGIEKVKYFENDPKWRESYGTILAHLPGIVDDIRFFAYFVPLESKPLKVIDYGCANGYFLRTLRCINPGLSLYGLEIAGESVLEAQGLFGKDKIFWQSCGEHVPLQDESIDFIYSISMIEHVPYDEEVLKMFKECSRILKKGGSFILRTPNCSGLMKTWWFLTGQHWLRKAGVSHSNLFSTNKLTKMLSPDFKIEKIVYCWGPSPVSKFFDNIHFSSQITLILRKR